MTDAAAASLLALAGPGARLWQAPGRINIVGEHVDYAGGLVLPFACDRRVVVAAVPDASTAGLRSLDAPMIGDAGWTRYVDGVVAALREAGWAVRGARGVIASTVPAGAGMASSAALQAAVALALTGGRAPDARVLQRAEHLAAGVRCGVMDQVATLHGEPGRALLLDCEAFTWESVPLPASLGFVVVDTGTRRSLDDGRYAARRGELEAAVAAAGVGVREMTLDDVRALALPAPGRSRLRHVVSEIGRVRAAVEALAAEDVEGLGSIMDESHASLRYDAEVSSPALDEAVAAARSAPGAVGARLVGAGFAGCVLAAVHEEASRMVIDSVEAALPGVRAFAVGSAGGAGELV